MTLRDWVPVEVIQAKVKIILEHFVPSILLIFLFSILLLIGKYVLPEGGIASKLLIWLDEFAIVVLAAYFIAAMMSRLITEGKNNGKLQIFLTA